MVIPTPSLFPLGEEKSRRAYKTIVGTTQHPEYNVNEATPRFKRDSHGKRLAPLSQLNTLTGRELARGPNPNITAHSTGHPLPAEHASRAANNVTANPPVNFSRHVPVSKSLSPARRTTSTYTVSHSTSSPSPFTSTAIATGRPRPIYFPLPTRAVTEPLEPSPCPVCKQRPSPFQFPSPSTRTSTDLSLTCPHCRSLTSSSGASLQTGEAVMRGTQLPPYPPRKLTPRPLRCSTCIPVPGALRMEFDAYVKEELGCMVCGEMSAESVGVIGRGNREDVKGSMEMEGWLRELGFDEAYSQGGRR